MDFRRSSPRRDVRNSLFRHERRLLGYAAAGETLTFSPPFAARPVVVCHDGLRAKPEDTTPAQVTFSGEATGLYEVIGQ